MSTADFRSEAQADSSRSLDGRPPLLVALFLIKFDLKVGYTIAWKRAIEGVQLEGVVEYKSLPSGLHNVQQDLVYFFHDRFAGVSAFAKGEAGAEARNAHFVAVGGLVPLKDGRLGRAWLHSDNFASMATQLVADSANVSILEEYWEEHGALQADAEDYQSPQLSPFTVAQRKSRAFSSATLSGDERQTLPPSHPALSTLEYLDIFGPLIFPLHRAALLRKRILFITTAPVRRACEFSIPLLSASRITLTFLSAYDLSVFTSAPLSLANSLVLPSENLARLQPLFAIGVHDIPFLEQQAKTPTTNSNGNVSTEDEPEDHGPSGWIACTTDEILAVKSSLYDIVVELPGVHRDQVKTKNRPIIKTAQGQAQIKATQRDLRRYRMLRQTLAPLRGNEKPAQGSTDCVDEEREHLLSRPPGALDSSFSSEDESNYDDLYAEPTTWSELAYSSFIWWASAGEKDEHLVEEENVDRTVLGDLGDVAEQVADEQRYKDDDGASCQPSRVASSADSSDAHERKDARIEMAIIGYFHRLTKKLFEISSEILDGERDEEDAEFDDIPNIHREDLRAMGLDVWSQGDKDFVQAFCELWYEREVKVDRAGVECCGIRVC